MKIVSINFLNIVEQIDKVSLIHGFTLEDFKIIDESPCKIDIQAISEVINMFMSALNCNPPAQLWLFEGELARFILRELPVHGCTLVEGRDPVISLTYYENINLLKRVLIHELSHSYRISYLDIKSQGEYARYIGNLSNLLYEELMAISLEKYFNSNLTLEDIIGFTYNPQWKNWSSCDILGDFKFTYLLEEDSFNKYMRTFVNNMPGIIYFLVYKICYETPIVEQIFEYMNRTTKSGFELLLSGFQPTHKLDSVC